MRRCINFENRSLIVIPLLVIISLSISLSGCVDSYEPGYSYYGIHSELIFNSSTHDIQDNDTNFENLLNKLDNNNISMVQNYTDGLFTFVVMNTPNNTLIGGKISINNTRIILNAWTNTPGGYFFVKQNELNDTKYVSIFTTEEKLLQNYNTIISECIISIYNVNITHNQYWKHLQGGDF